MKKIIIAATAALLVALSVQTVFAEDTGYDLSGVYQSLSDDAARQMYEMGVDSADASARSSLGFEDVMSRIAGMAAENSGGPLSGLVTITALMLVCSMLSAYKNTLSGDVSETLNTVCALCVSGAVALPASQMISSAGGVVVCCANLFLAYIPIVTAMIATSGSPLSSASYYAAAIAAGEGAARASADVLVPFLNMLLGLGVTAGVSPHIRLDGLISMLSRALKWCMGLMMTVFTAVLSFRQLLSGSLDSVGGRLARFALGSFVPIVGSALSEAYGTVQGSISTLKSGLGVFVIIAVAVTFLPLVLQTFLWSLTIWTGRAAAQVMGLTQTAGLLESLGAVFSALLAVLLCMAAVFIICTAAAFSAGGAS